MPRAKTILQSEFPYNVTGRCINKDWFGIPMPDVWQIYCEELNQVHRDKSLLIHSFVLISNHFHLIASTPEANISQCMHQFMYRTSRRLTLSGNRINQTYGGRHYKCILQHHSYFLNAYNYRNPVTAGICDRVEKYEFSSLQALANPDSRSELPTIMDSEYKSDPSGTIDWLNSPPQPEKLEGVRIGLRRQYFRPKKCRNSNNACIEIGELI